MKKQISIAMGLAVLSTGALASKARLEALGQDANGSMFLEDSRNVMLNPATLNFNKDFVTMEFGDTTGTTDSTKAPRAEGGMFKASGNMVYGMYFGSESNTSNGLRASSGTMAEQNNTDFFVAGDAGVQWGARLTYHDFQDKQASADTTSSAMRATLGVISGNIETYLNIGLQNKAEVGASEFNGKSAMALGLTYAMGDVDYMVKYEALEAENTASKSYKVQNTHIGVAKTYKLNDKANAWASAWYKMDTMDDGWAGTEKKSTFMPLSIALEVMAKDWLTFRGSVTQNFIGTTEDTAGDEKTIADTTKVAAGASLIFGDLTIDGVIGNNAGAKAIGTDTAGGAGTLRTDTLMSRVSMTYKF